MVLHNVPHARLIGRRSRLDLLQSPYSCPEMALDSASDQICVSYITKEDERLLSECEIIMFCGQNINSLFTMLKCNTQLMDLVQCVMTYAETSQLQFEVQFLQNRLSVIAQDLQSSQIIQDARLPTCCRYILVKNPVLKNVNIFLFWYKAEGAKHWNRKLGTAHLNDAAAFRSMKKMRSCLSWLQKAELKTHFLQCCTCSASTDSKGPICVFCFT